MYICSYSVVLLQALESYYPGYGSAAAAAGYYPSFPYIPTTSSVSSAAAVPSTQTYQLVDIPSATTTGQLVIALLYVVNVILCSNGARYSYLVEHLLMVQWVVGLILHDGPN